MHHPSVVDVSREADRHPVAGRHPSSAHPVFLEIAVVLLLTVVNGVLAMSELAVVSSRPTRLMVLRDAGNRGAATALKLAEDPGRFLSTVQIGITLVGVLSGAFSGATLGARLSEWLGGFGLPQGVAEALGVGTVVVAITYLSLIVGELVPKQIALRDPEAVAARVAPAMALLSKVAAPLVWLLDASGRFVLGLLGQKGQGDDKVTEEEVKTIIAQAEDAGVLERGERDLISGVMRLSDRNARGLMTPRTDVEMLDLSHDRAAVLAQLRRTRRSRLPVQDGDADTITGVIFTKDAIQAIADDPRADIRKLVQEVPIVADTARALDILEAIRGSVVHMVLVFDEYGHFEGVITSGDVLEAIIGALAQEGEEDEPAYLRRADGSFLVSGWMPIDEFVDKIGVKLDREVGYETVAGLVLDTLNRLPEAGDRFSLGHWTFEILDMDGRRIDKLLVSRVPVDPGGP